MLKHHFTFCLLLISLLANAQQDSIQELDKLIEANKLKQAKRIIIAQIEEFNKLDYWEKLGDIYGIEKQWDSAIICYSNIVNKNPDYANGHFKLGGVYGMKALSVNKFRALTIIDDVKFHLKKAAALDVNHIEARWALIELYLQLPGIIGGSVKLAKKFATELKDISNIEYFLANAYIANYRKKEQEAKEWSLKALAVSHKVPEDYKRVNIHYQLGKASASYSSNLNLGIKHLQWFIQNHKKSNNIEIEWAYLYKAKIYAKLNDSKNAIEQINKALKANSNFKEALVLKQQLQTK